MALTRKVTMKLRERDPYCLHCGADTELQIHHRRNRGMGGSKLIDGFDNLVRVCALLNYQMEQDPKVAEDAREKGWKLRQWDSFDSPVFDQIEAQWYQLDTKGNKIPVEAPSYLI